MPAHPHRAAAGWPPMFATGVQTGPGWPGSVTRGALEERAASATAAKAEAFKNCRRVVTSFAVVMKAR